MIRRTEGIVLKGFPYGEADLIVTFLTRDFGVARAFAKSPRKTKSRFGSSLEPLTCSVISLMGREDAALPRLTQADIVRPHQALRENYQCFVMLSDLLALTLRLLPDGKPAPEAYALLRAVLDEIDGEGCTATLALLYRVRLLSLEGFGPRVRGCGRCGGGDAGAFHPGEGAVMCGDCMPRAHGAIALSAGSVKLYEALATWELAKVGRLRAGAAMMAELGAVLDAHLAHVLARREHKASAKG